MNAKRSNPRLSSLVPVALMLAVLVFTAAEAVPGPPSLEPASSGGLQAIDRALARLSTHLRLLVVGAHPDDEDTRLLAWVARGMGGEAAYLSLSRGEGGQNLIGPELGEGLGLLRSQELLAARRIDGGRQYFTRAYDFGYTRSVDETWERWPREEVLVDAIRVIRRFKPQILVAVFPGTARAGHGQHQVSGLVAAEAFDLAGDPEISVWMAREGLHPWQATTFYRSAFFNREAATHDYPLGELDPWTGHSIFQISLRSRSQHRCQDMGLTLPLGDARGYLIWEKGGQGPDAEDVFAGVDTRLRAIAFELEGELKVSVEERLDRVEELARGARRELNAVEPGKAAGPLLEIVRLLRAVDADLGEIPLGDFSAGPRQQVRDLVREKLGIAQEALATAAQVLADAYTDREAIVPGTSFVARTVFWNAGAHEVSTPELRLTGAFGWGIGEPTDPEHEPSFFATEATWEKVVEITLDPDRTAPTLPYFLRFPRRRDLYTWRFATPEERGEPFEQPPLVATLAFEIDGVPVELEREVVYRARDQAYGEIRRPIRAVPALELTLDPPLIVWPFGKASHEMKLTVRSNLDRPVSAKLEVDLAAGWQRFELPRLEIDQARGTEVVEFTLNAPAQLRRGRVSIGVIAVTDDGLRYDKTYPLVDYEHIRPTPMFVVGRTEIVTDDLAFPAIERLGFVLGASRRVPVALERVGLPVEVLSGDELDTRDLSVYDAIVVGSRAYETDAGLARTNGRLLDYARSGGTVIVLYQQYQFVQGGFAPLPLEIHRPHDRVTDETAAVTVLDPGHPVFTTPNRIVESDWQDWVQERGLYFAGTWDDAYTPLLAMADPGGEEQRGALLVAEVGEGRWVYTGLSFFRQLPAGVSGAYRLFANLLALGQEDSALQAAE